MIKAITIINSVGESVRINLTEDDPDHGFLIYHVEGLGGAKADINTTTMATADGSLYNSARVEQRNIVMKLLLSYADSIEDSRQRVYKYFPIKKPVQLLVESDNRSVKTTGYVETCEPDIWSKQEMVQVSLICPDPFFYSEFLNTTIFSGIDPLFEFEFENDDLEEPLLEMGSIEIETERNVYYDGDADIGVTIRIHALGEAKNISIYNVRTRQMMKIDTEKVKAITGSGIVASDDIIINTVRGNKSIQLFRSGHYINILNCLDRGSDWFQLTKGDNIFAYVADEGAENLYFTIENNILYEGV